MNVRVFVLAYAVFSGDYSRGLALSLHLGDTAGGLVRGPHRGRCRSRAVAEDRRRLRRASTMENGAEEGSDSVISDGSISHKKFLVVGGSGRVGGSVVVELVRRGGTVVVGGRSRANFVSAQERWSRIHPSLQTQLSNVQFEVVDRENKDTVVDLVRHYGSVRQSPFDLLVHTAGPFQGKSNCLNGVIAAAVECAVPYVDVCDDFSTATAAKANFATAALGSSTPCIVSTGCWPGVSSIMAKQLTSSILRQQPDLRPSDLSVDFSFFTAGSGGAGATLLVATFLILAEKALAVVQGKRTHLQPMSVYTTQNFGKTIGNKEVAPLNLLETASVHEMLGIGSVQSRFGTAPAIWNRLLTIVAQLPESLLSNEPIMEKLAVFSLPVVRLVDTIAGATNAMRCDVRTTKDLGVHVSALYAHENLEPCVGECVVAFCAAVLSGSVAPGVWFPEEAIDDGKDAAAVLRIASVGAHTVETEGINAPEVWGRDGT